MMVKVSEVVPFREMLAAPNALEITGGATGVSTVIDAEAVLPVPPFVEVTLPDVLFFIPAVVPLTFTTSVQLLLVAIVPPVSDTLPEPGTAVAVPPQVLLSPFGVAATSPAGRLSLNATPARLTVLAAGLMMVKVSEVVPFREMLAAPNALLMTGGATTVIESLDVLPIPPSFDVTVTLLFFTPAVVPVTSTLISHGCIAARVPPDRLTEDDPATAVAVPPQVLIREFGVATIRPAGKLSVKAIPVSVTLVSGFKMWKLSEVLPFKGMLASENPLMIEGGSPCA